MAKRSNVKREEARPHKNIGSSFSDFLEAEGIREEVEDVAIKRVVAWQLEQEMIKQGITRTVMARKMKTSRTTVNRLLNPENNSGTIQTLNRTARVLGRKLSISLA